MCFVLPVDQGEEVLLGGYEVVVLVEVAVDLEEVAVAVEAEMVVEEAFVRRYLQKTLMLT